MNTTKSTTDKNPEFERIGRTIFTLRERYGFSQKQFAAELGISRSYVSLIEAGFKPLPNRMLSKMADLLEITPLAIKRFDNEEMSLAA